jgi:hypothetical protein
MKPFPVARFFRLLLPALLLAGCGTLDIHVENSGATTGSAWVPFTTRDFPLSFEYPATWKGPVESVADEAGREGQISITIGSDSVYPWADDYPAINYPRGAYEIVITYLENASRMPLVDLAQNDNRLRAWMDLVLVGDGESTLVHKIQYTRLASVAADDFRGLEFIAATPANAQTDILYRHHAVLASQDRVLIVTGTVPNPGATTPATWREIYTSLDGRYRAIFLHVVESIRVGS